jgi:uncharacterized protein YndB with AHSA1/START domain
MAAIRHQINVAVPVRTVWKALTTEEGLTGWWGRGARVDPRPGGRVVITSEDAEGQAVEERGLFHELRPTRKIEIAWDTTSSSLTRGTRVVFQLARDADETRLSLVQSVTGEDDTARAELDALWRQRLLALRGSLEGEE